MEVTSFAAINKFQPFNVAISSNVLLLLVRPLPGVGWGTQVGTFLMALGTAAGRGGCPWCRFGAKWLILTFSFRISTAT